MSLPILLSVSPGAIFAVLVAIAIFCVAMYQVLMNLIYICGPNEILVFSGLGGYKVVKGGRHLRIPLLQEVDRLDLTNINIEVGVREAFSKGGIPLNIDGIANVKIAGEPPGRDNALQRLLGKPRPLIMRIAKETLEGYLRGVLATLTPEEINENTQTFEKELFTQAMDGFTKLGLTLDNLKIQSVQDEKGFLTAVGRIQVAELNRDNRMFEARQRAESLTKQAEARRRGELAKINAELQIAKAESERRVNDAQTAEKAWVAEQQGQVKALLTRANAELKLQEERIKQMKHQLNANVVTPAEKDMEARIAQARGDAAPILERGRAQAEALRGLAETWHKSGANAKDIFLLQKLEAILPIYLDSVRRVKVDNITMLQGISGGNGGSLPGQAVATVKALEAGGVDVSGLLNRLAGGKGKGPKAKLEAPEKRRSPSQRQTTTPSPEVKMEGFTPIDEPSRPRLIRKRGGR